VLNGFVSSIAFFFSKSRGKLFEEGSFQRSFSGFPCLFFPFQR